MTGYILEHRRPGDEWIRLNDTPTTELKHVVRGLAPLTDYEFRVAAVNRCGTGSFSNASEAITTEPPSLSAQPGWPRIIKLAGTSVTLQWTTPDDGVDEVTGYIVHYGAPGAAYAEARFDGQVTTCTVTQLKPRTKYHFAVAAENKFGGGHLSEFSEYIMTHEHSGKRTRTTVDF